MGFVGIGIYNFFEITVGLKFIGREMSFPSQRTGVCSCNRAEAVMSLMGGYFYKFDFVKNIKFYFYK
jgi:hypothetical protein